MPHEPPISLQMEGRIEQNVPRSCLKVHPKNPRRGNLDSIKESIRVNGFAGVIVAQEGTGHIVAGNHRFMAACALGFTAFNVHWLPLSDTEAERLMLADNRTSDLGSYDDRVLADMLKGLGDTDLALSGTGYDQRDLDNLLALLGDVQQPDLTPPEPDSPDLAPQRTRRVKRAVCPACQHEFDVEAGR